MWYTDFLAGYLGTEHPLVGALVTLWMLGITLQHANGGMAPKTSQDRFGRAGEP